MKKNYVFFLFIITILFSIPCTYAQENKPSESFDQRIEGLSIYPNPANRYHNYINISSKLNAPKTIEIFNVIGKRILITNIISKELNISNLKTGVYLLKITENNVSETRKLVIH
ncbi:T9SS type A sorting domain-containing protein [Tamlana fucoidanivorans]|uniref:T9SS type A sorting domain-containing protein n=1 Tax=Allotamlana fucoidanivorans TaxID=2583814 RepID=A0A5C4SLF7_9FLAO|nr:T9SS type A sorting domain-containing protein [Tamlana fucoidanivorans]TNJ44240.1 T9SS type A sorting domain-containing protein [Tamlana fucoidanivorans]